MTIIVDPFCEKFSAPLRLLHYKWVFLAFHNQASNGLTFHDLFFPWESRLILGYSMRIGHWEY